jgi:hypothetical protein
MSEQGTGIEQTTAGGARPVDSRGSAETYGLSCSECGGSLRVHEGERSVRCEYCNCALFVTRPSGVRSFMMKPRITAGKVRLAALHYLSKSTGGRVKTRHASIIDLQLINMPFWRMHGRLMGWVCGDKTMHREVEVSKPTPRGEQVVTTVRSEQQPYAKLVFKKVEWSTPACTLQYLGLQGISLKMRFLNWDIFDHELKTKQNFALPMKSADQARSDGFNYLTRLVTPTGASVRANRFHLFDSNFSLYYYPVYFLRYRHAGRIYTITIDGNDGRIIRGDIPKQTRIKAKNMFFVPAAFAFLAGTWLPLVLIALTGVYVYDLINTEGFLPPHRWFFSRLNAWFGGE